MAVRLFLGFFLLLLRAPCMRAYSVERLERGGQEGTFYTAVKQLGVALGLLGQPFHHRRPVGDRGVRFPGRGTGVIYHPHGLNHPLRQ